LSGIQVITYKTQKDWRVNEPEKQERHTNKGIICR
jgi:hypothetical protein